MRFQFLTVAGVGHVAPNIATELRVGAAVVLVQEERNAHDADAVAVNVGGTRVGYVTRPQAPGLRYLLRSAEIDAQLARVNGTPERPLLGVLVRCDCDATRRMATARTDL